MPELDRRENQNTNLQMDSEKQNSQMHQHIGPSTRTMGNQSLEVGRYIKRVNESTLGLWQQASCL